MWVKFTKDFDFKPKPTVTKAYKAGMVENVTQACAEQAIALGKAEKTARPAGEKAEKDGEPPEAA